MLAALCDGMPRSASTWAYNACRLIVKTLYPDYRVAAGFSDTPGEYIDSNSEHFDAIVVKSHAVDETARSMIAAGRVKAIYTHRDPYDAVVSHMRMFNQPFEHSLEAIRKSLEVLMFHIETGGFMEIVYSDIVEKPGIVLDRVISHISPGRVLSASELFAILGALSRTAMQKKAEAVGTDADDLVREGDLVYSRQTLLHRHHIRDGGTGYGRSTLTAEQEYAAAAMLSSTLPASVVRDRHWV